MKRLTRMTAAAVIALIYALGGDALAATTVSATLGPIPVPAVPVSICVDATDPPISECVSTPPTQTVTLSVTVAVDDPAPAVVPPAVVPIPCPAGTQGVALQIFSGTVSATISGSVTVTVDATPTVIPIGTVVTTPDQTVTIYACAGVSPGV